MPSFRGLGLSFIMLIMMIDMVKGRWLEVDTFSTSMISDGVHDTAYDNPPNLRLGVSNSSVTTTTFYAEKRCHSIYGFLPCADTMQEGVFLMLMYTYLMMLGEEWIHKGSHALFHLIGDKAIGASVFRVLMALPRIVIVIVSGVLSTTSDAQNQVAFGVGMYAGSTVICLTLIWGIRIILSRDMLRGKGSTSEHQNQQESSTTWLSLIKHKLSALTDTGVNIDKETGDIAVMMLLSLIPFATVELVALIKSPVTILFALLVSCVSLLLYFAYQIWDPLIKFRSLTYLKQENLRTRFFFHVQRLEKDNLIDEHGNPNFEAFESIFTTADGDKDGCLSHDELENLIENKLKLGEDQISKDYAKAEILTHFDNDKSGMINRSEFRKGCSKWLDKWKNDAKNSGSFFQKLWNQVEGVEIENKRANLTKIEKIMPRILKQVLEQRELVTQDGKPNIPMIEGLFSNYDKDSDGKMGQSELEQFIASVQFGISLEPGTVLKELVKDFDHDRDKSIQKKEFVHGFVKWIEKAINDDPSIKDPKDAIAKYEEKCWQDINTSMEKPKASILYVVFGVGIIYLISGAFIQSVIQFSNAAHIPFLFTSFVMAPIAMNARMVITALLNVGPRVSTNASLAFSELYSGLVMNNLLGLSTLLTTVYVKGLSWSYSAEVVIIIIPCAIVGAFAFKRCTYPLWASICAMLLYPISVYFYCGLES